MQGVVLLNGLSEEELIGLYKSVDAFVLPSRGEGWGRPYMEAMAMGLPVIASNWSGPTAFVTEDNGYLLKIKGLVDAKLDTFPGHRWAEPDKEALKELLVRIHDNPEEGRKKGKNARRDILEKWSHEKVALGIRKELERITRFGGKMPTVEDEERINDGQIPKTESAVRPEEEIEAAKGETKQLVQEREEESSSVAVAAAEEEDVDAERGQGGQNDRGQHHDEL